MLRKPTKDLRIIRSTTTLHELALEKVHEAILSFHYKPGERLVERKLCEELGVSRTVVREVLRHLQAEGLVSIYPHRGPQVAVMDADTARQVYEIRSWMESMAARTLAKKHDPLIAEKLRDSIQKIEKAFKVGDTRAIVKRTEEFYHLLFVGSDMSLAWEIIRNLNARINVLRALTVSSQNRGSTGPEEMKRIVKAIEAGDPSAAEEACRSHVANAYAIAKIRLSELEKPEKE